MYRIHTPPCVNLTVCRFSYYVGGEVVTVSHLDKPMYLLGYLPKENRAYLADKDFNVVRCVHVRNE